MPKIITLSIFRADRELWDGGETTLQVRDMRPQPGKPVILKRATLAAGSNSIQVNLDLFFDAGQVYALVVEAEGHRPGWQFLTRQSFLNAEGGTMVEAKGKTVRIMLVPNDPSSADLDQGYTELRAAGSPTVADNTGLSDTEFRNLPDDADRMALLNIDAKLRETRINGVSLLSYVVGLERVDVDRLFLFVRPEVKQLVDVSSEFAGAPGHPGHPDSWKHTLYDTGEIQVSFAKATIPHPKDNTKLVFSVDADIDLESGLNHWVEFLDNKIIHPSRKTNQTLVYALLFAQGVIPHYTLSPQLS
jgi:hypothetical protein